MKTTFRASPDVALIKYWGKKDAALRIPANGSISMVLAGLDTTTTVEFQDHLTADDIMIQGETKEIEVKRVRKHLDRIRQTFGKNGYAKVVSENNFPKGTGLSSSGSGFAALTYAAVAALGLTDVSSQQMSILGRLASGTACRCACGGFVEWTEGRDNETSYSQSIYPADHWDLVDVIAIVSRDMKKTTSTEGHALAETSPFFAARQAHINGKLSVIKEYLAAKDFTPFGELIEAEALEFHSILHTSNPSFIAWYPGTIDVMERVRMLRKNGIEAYFTINTGFNVHVLTLPQYQQQVADTLKASPFVSQLLTAKAGPKPNPVTTHLF